MDSELRFGLGLAVEAKVLADINATSGIQTQSYTTSGLTTLRKGLTTLETAGDADGGQLFVPCGWCGKREQETESGRRRRWCSDACRMKSYRAHRRSK